jgi:hypothetical protein
MTGFFPHTLCDFSQEALNTTRQRVALPVSFHDTNYYRALTAN